MPKTAVIYARVSDKKQAENEVSVPAQIAAGERRAAELDAAVLRVFTDQGRSAYKEGNRPAFEAAIDYAATVGADYFITWSSSRFSRNQIEGVLFKRALDRAKVTLVYASATVDRGTDEGWMLDSMFGLMDEMFSRQNAKDTKRSMLANARNGFFCGGRPPYGYRSAPAPENPKRKRLEVVDEEAETVRWIFAERASGRGGLLIAQALNAQHKRARGRTWTKRAVLEILRSESVIGQSVFNRTDSKAKQKRPREEWVIVDSHPPIIPRGLWDRVQALMDEGADAHHAGSSKSEHPFTGLIRCACGAGMIITTGTGRHGTLYSYYRCRAVHMGQPCEHTQRYPASKLDERLSSVILGKVLTRENLTEIATAIQMESDTWREEAAKQSASISKRITDLKARNSRLYDLMELHGKDTPNLGDLTSRLRDNNAEIKALEQQLVSVRAEQVSAALPDIDLSELETFLQSTLRRKELAVKAREFYRQFIDSIDIIEKNVVITYNPSRLAVASPGGVRSNVNWRPECALLRTRKVVFELGFFRSAA